jgi:hypothetical protein
MKVRYVIAVIISLTCTMPSLQAEMGITAKRVFLDKEGGIIEVRAAHTEDTETRDAVRQELQKEARTGAASGTPDLGKYKKDIRYRYENTPRGGRIRIVTKSPEALAAVQEFLRSQMNQSLASTVAFDYIDNTSLVVIQVMVNGHGPYKFLLDTGASDTILSIAVADKLKLDRGQSRILISPGGRVPVTVRPLNSFQVGAARLEHVSIAVGNFDLMKTLHVDGILGGDYLRRFKVSIDYDNQLVNIEPFNPDTFSKLLA